MIAVVRQRSRTKAWVFVVLLLLLAVVGSVSYLAWRQSVPVARATVQAPRFLGHNASVNVDARGRARQLQRAEVRIVQGGTADHDRAARGRRWVRRWRCRSRSSPPRSA